MTIWRGMKGVGVQPCLSPDNQKNGTNTALQSLVGTGPQPSILANGIHACRESTCWHVQLFIFGYLLLSLRYPRVDATPGSARRCVDLFWEVGYGVFFPVSAGRIEGAFHVRPL